MLKGRLFTGLLACLMVTLAVPLTVNADTVYVHPTEGAYHTIADGVGAAAVGDTVLVGPGNYGSFTVSKKLYIKSEAGPDMTKITAGASVTFTADADNASMSGFTVTIPGDEGVYIESGCNYLTIKNNIISGCGGHGLHFHVENSGLTHATLINNTVSNNTGCGIYFYAKCSGYACSTQISNCAISNNIVSSNIAYGIQYDNQGGGQFNNNVFSYNNLWSNNAGSSSNVTIDSSAGNLFIDPLFLDPDTGDLHLQAASECIDAGKVGSPYNDPDGTRNDIGVYGGPGAADFWPYPAGGPVVTDLSVTPPSVPVGGTLTLKATGKIR